MNPKTSITRFELGSTFQEFDLKMNQKGFIGTKVLRPRIVGKNAADVGKIPLKELLVSRSTKRAPGSGYARDTFDFDKFPYAVAEYGKEEVLDDGQLAIYGDIVDGETISADRAEDAVLNEYERDVAGTVFDPTTWAGALKTDLTTPWTDHANAAPIDNVSAAIEAVANQCGLEANALVLNRKLVRDLMNCDQIVDRVKFTARPSASELRNALADLFDLPHILVAGGMKNIANAGQDASIARIWSSDFAMVCRVAESDDPREPAIGRTFIWPGDGPAAPGDDGKLAVVVEEYREEKVRGQVFRARNNRDIVIMYAQAGHLITNTDGTV